MRFLQSKYYLANALYLIVQISYSNWLQWDFGMESLYSWTYCLGHEHTFSSIMWCYVDKLYPDIRNKIGVGIPIYVIKTCCRFLSHHALFIIHRFGVIWIRIRNHQFYPHYWPCMEIWSVLLCSKIFNLELKKLGTYCDIMAYPITTNIWVVMDHHTSLKEIRKSTKMVNLWFCFQWCRTTYQWRESFSQKSCACSENQNTSL